MSTSPESHQAQISALMGQLFPQASSRGHRRRFEILEAMIDAIASEGLEKTSFDTLGKRLGLRRTHVAYYFANREELIFATLQYVLSIGQARTVSYVAPATSWRERLQLVVEAPFVWLHENPRHAAVMTVFYHYANFHERFRALHTQVQSMGEARLLACFEPAVEAGNLSSAQALKVAKSIHAMQAGSLLYFFTMSSDEEPEKRLDTFKKNTTRTVQHLLEHPFADDEKVLH